MIELRTFDDPRAHSDALAHAVSDALKASLAARGAADASAQTAHATLAVSGGTSPKPFLQTLSRELLDWAHIDVTLVDDRWVPESDAASNAHLVRDTLLQHAAAATYFLPLVDTSKSLETHVAELNADTRYRLPDVVVLGMGEDGHTASIFADAPEWDVAISTSDRYVAVHPGSAPHARVSLSMSALRQVRQVFLFIAGQKKLDVLNAALATQQKNAISTLANDEGVKLDVYWCA
ncbi:6-phosphogluconolactonase, eukaryotic type [Candidatus Burkholderia verschuerenii]|uniref:6-phosphogluconolactonase n=1 Tax=Candidatus Burkholderia verschuerenii TaxID=242163 RepID=A0A0L0MCR0_9BURK|nr:6-phosphogluconolactonase [Candidatus Burkholderia verschuerenii]KND60055.1 6-phosphogluconolactonase, eukaryotic type [Candidatus Burkholderia verschuerenii]